MSATTRATFGWQRIPVLVARCDVVTADAGRVVLRVAAEASGHHVRHPVRPGSRQPPRALAVQVRALRAGKPLLPPSR
jgi:hypothetical protein